MPRPVEGYRNKAGERVPGVSTISGRFKDSGALIAWAWKEGKQGRDFRQTRDKAADAGNYAHALADAWIKKAEPPKPPDDPATRARGEKAFGAFREWADQTSLKVTHSEITLVSEAHQVGGTFDAMLIGSRRMMADIKTSSGLWPEMLIQVAGYGILWDEAHPEEPIQGYAIMRFDREFGDYHFHVWPELDTAREAFILLRRLYSMERELKARAK